MIKMSILKEQILNLTIEKLNHDGLGIAYNNKIPILIDNALPGEVIKIKVTEIFREYALAKNLEIITFSQFRIIPPCKYFMKCGGCRWQHFSLYNLYKSYMVAEALKEIISEDVIHPIIKIPHNSRRRASFKVKDYKLSFNKMKSKETIAISNCLLLNDEINNLITPINDLLKKNRLNISALNITNSDTGIELLFSGDKKLELEHYSIFSNFANHFDIARIAWQVKKYNPSSVIQRKPVQIICDGIAVDLPINSFLQVSKESSFLMNEIILSNLDSSKVLELYCGCGSFTISMALKANIYAVEGSDVAIDALDRTAKKFKLPIKTLVQDLYQNPITYDFINNYTQVVINPPRNGATPQIKQISKALSVKKVILVSCSLNNFIRDSKFLLEANFKITDIYPIDQFLYSSHIEIIAIFDKA